MRHVFLGTEGFPATVYASQVGDLLAVLDRELGLRFDMVNFDPLLPATLATREGRARIEELRNAVPGRLVVRPFVPYEDRLGSPLARRLLARELRGPTVLHARNLQAAALACDLAQRDPRLAVLYDARGDALAEHAFHRTGRGDGEGLRTELGAWRLRRAEARVCRVATRILCVSNALKDVLDRRHLGSGAKAVVVPSGHDPSRFRLDPELRAAWRQRLRLDGAFVVTYAGSLVSYQLPEEIARAGALARSLRPDAHLLMLTPDVDRARRLCRQAGIPPGASTCVQVVHADMPGALNASDLALLLRRPDPVNRVASPTKLAEYLACGVPVLLSDGIGDTSALVREEGLGVVLDAGAELSAALAALLDALPAREHVAAVARDRLARDRFTDVYRELYADLAAAVG